MLVAKAHRRIRNQRAAFHHDASRWLVDRFGVIAVEDLNIKGLSRGMLAKSVHDAGWNAFFQKLSYNGACVPKTLRDRWHECSACGLSAARDVVSAQVILQRSLARIGPSRLNVEAVSSCVPREAVALQATK